MTGEPTGVFVRLPLSGEQITAVDAVAKEIAENNAENEWRFARHHFSACDDLIRAIGTPVTGGELKTMAHISRGGDRISLRRKTERDIPLVRQSDAQAAIAALEAEIAELRTAEMHVRADAEAAKAEVGRLLEYYEANEDIKRTGLFGATAEMFDRERLAREALKGPEA